MIDQFILDNQLNAMRLHGAKVGAERSGERAIAITNPYTGARIGSVPKATLDEVRATFARAAAYKATLTRFERAAILNRAAAISSRRLDTYISLLTSSIGIRRFTYTQHLDIMRGLSEGVKDVIYAYYTNIHQNNLSIIVPREDVRDSPPSSSSAALNPACIRCLVSASQPAGAKPQPKATAACSSNPRAARTSRAGAASAVRSCWA